MKRLKDLRIGKNQYLSHIIKQIEINIILFKFLCGIGATSQEAENQLRCSVIIVPNKPVIEGKCAKYNSKRKQKVILGIYEGITKDDVVEYIQSDVYPKKIITTPESFPKFKDAMEELGLLQDMYDNYFIMFDECERAIQDVDYRKKIIIPMDDFFRFKNKAFISATPIVPSDPRFEKHGFREQRIVPTFNHKQEITLKVTNNVFYTIKKHFAANVRDQYFFFFNSTNTIAYLMDYLNIKDESAVFCSRDSKNKLKLNGYKNAYTSLTSFKKYNFFTSRFFSAVDIDGVENPHIVTVTDLVSAEHSMIDPASEAIQIVGRFRKDGNKKMVKEVTHITNINPKLEVLSEEHLLIQIKEFEKLHRTLRRYYKASQVPVVRAALKEMMTRADFAKYINFDGTKNYYMQDNAVFQEKIKGYYQNAEKLMQAYKDSNHFKLKPQAQEEYQFNDEARVKIQSSSPLKTTFEIVMPLVKDLYDADMNMFSREMQLAELQVQYPEVIKALNIVGIQKAKELKFDPRKIRKEMNDKEMRTEQTNFRFIQLIEKQFVVGKSYSSQQIKSKLRFAIRECNLQKLKPTISLLEEYCKLSNRCWIGTNEMGKDMMGYKILEVYDSVKTR